MGTIIRIAQCMSLHRDGEIYQLSPIQTQIRRLVWHQICALDLRTCEAQGPQPGVRKDEYDTKMPWDIDDQDLHYQLKPMNRDRRWSEARSAPTEDRARRRHEGCVATAARRRPA